MYLVVCSFSVFSFSFGVAYDSGAVASLCGFGAVDFVIAARSSGGFSSNVGVAAFVGDFAASSLGRSARWCLAIV